MTGRFVVMGVSGCGKSHIGAAFAEVIGARFFDGDDLHPRANVAKMSAGVPLTDADRAPWLERVGGALRHPGTVIACSALRRAYREAINDAAGAPVTYLFLNGEREILLDRMTRRDGHFMSPALLDSQIATLEAPGPDEICVTADIDAPPRAIVARFLSGLLEEPE
ncbi:gluconokinase [Halovulum dunhuangense]|uniref:Gluconokinase n=1 Tax=Halovulum dunhuangense TaxID=1505036 RepID=A0A849L2H1_9RHOB|nr:gluconokinase [Halovulum dunhuangense]NNU80417.1 gluconokinase [Halovulum dunhuangense]